MAVQQPLLDALPKEVKKGQAVNAYVIWIGAINVGSRWDGYDARAHLALLPAVEQKIELWHQSLKQECIRPLTPLNAGRCAPPAERHPAREKEF
jgi:hypothetical protein